MRYIVMHKASPQDEAGVLPPPKLIEQMGQLIGEAAKAGTFLAGEGLKPSATRQRLSFRGGECRITKGPYAGEHELPAAFAAIRVAAPEQAVAWAQQFARALGGDVDLELGALTEEWDLGFGQRPADAPHRFLVVQKATAATEQGTPLPPANQKALAQLLEQSTRDGVLQLFETLQPSRTARRLHYRDNVRRTVDGPFSESKELIGGFCMVQMRSPDEVAEWADRFARIVGGTVEIDLRPVAEPAGTAR